MIAPEILERATAYAREPKITFSNLRRYIELLLEDADRQSAARRGGIALDSVPHTSRYLNPECSAAAEEIWNAVQAPDPLPFFNGKPWHQGMADYLAHVGPQKSKEAAYV